MHSCWFTKHLGWLNEFHVCNSLICSPTAYLPPPLEVISSLSFFKSFLHFSISTTFRPSTRWKKEQNSVINITKNYIILLILIYILNTQVCIEDIRSTLFSNIASLLVTSVFSSLILKALKRRNSFQTHSPSTLHLKCERVPLRSLGKQTLALPAELLCHLR